MLNDAQPVGHEKGGHADPIRADTQVRPYGNPQMWRKTDTTIADIPAGINKSAHHQRFLPELGKRYIRHNKRG